MRKTTICTFIGLMALCAFLSSSHCAAIEPAPNGWFEYTVFFHSLTLAGQFKINNRFYNFKYSILKPIESLNST